MKKILLSLCFFASLAGKTQIHSKLEISANILNFDSVYTDTQASQKLIISSIPAGFSHYSNDTIKLKVLGKGFTVSDSILSASKLPDTVQVYFKPGHNINFHSHLLISAGPAGTLSVTLKGIGRYKEAYYNATQGLSGNALKSALKNIISANYVSLGYNLARDSMFMSIDNKKVNGQGAGINTLECVYTGRLAQGYTSRADAQSTTYNFNTEHTWPQSQFGQSEPMRSDLHHLFPTDNPANGVRADYPFGIVSSPNWSEGGSKGINGLFEPRNAQKGKTARAMFYFALRYQNYDSFLNQQETQLRAWSLQFPPDNAERRRNDAIFRNQKNRNPFVDHPEFLERIKYVHKADPPDPLNNSVLVLPDAMIAGPEGTFIVVGWKYRVHCAVINTGNVSSKIDSIQMVINDQLYRTHSGYPADISINDSILDPSESAAINIELYPFFSSPIDSIYIFGTGFQKKISMDMRYWSEAIEEPQTDKFVVYPNPANHSISFKLAAGEQFESIELSNSVGQKLLCTDFISSPDEINIAYLPCGLYFVKLKTATGKIYSDKLLKY